MGNALENWRSSIGCFNTWSKQSTANKSMGHINDALPDRYGYRPRFILLCILLTALVMGGVETNPGPIYSCKSCGVDSVSIMKYVTHQKIHNQDRNVRFQCPYPQCINRFISFNQFKNHVTRHHHKGTVNVNKQKSQYSSYMKFTCSNEIRLQKFSTMHKLITHTRWHSSVGDLMTCPFMNCNHKFSKKTVLNTHISKIHRAEGIANFQNNQDKNVEENFVPLLEDIDVRSPTQSCMEDVTMDEECESNYENEDVVSHIAKFYLKLEAEYLLPASTVQNLVEDMKNIIEINHADLKNTLKQELIALNVPLDSINLVINKCINNDSLYNAHNKCNDFKSQSLHSRHFRSKYYKKNFKYVAPIKISLGVDSYGIKRSAQYIPIKDTLSMLLEDKSVQEQIERNKSQEKDILTDFEDGEVFKNHPIFKDLNKISLQLMLYQDSFEVVNPLGSGKTKHKVLGIYYTLGNFSPELRSNIGNIQLAMLVRERDFKTFGQQKVLNRIVNDLKPLETDGLIYKGSKVPVVLACILGDNLGSHCVGGFVENFSGHYFCRFCPIVKDDFLTAPCTLHPLRSIEDYEESTIKVHNDDLVSHEGIKFDSVFNVLPTFHVCNPGLPPCLGHDLFEGIVDYDFSLMIKHFVIKNKWFTYTSINRKIERQKFAGSDNSNRPAPINMNGLRLGGHAVQNWYLVRFFSLLIGNFVSNPDDPVWQLYLKLKEMCKIICAPSISTCQIAYLQVLIEDYIQSRQTLFPNNPIKPKHHFLVHYPELIVKFGPLIRIWTLRFESKHSYFKRTARVCHNFINITKTLALKHQLHFAYSTSSEIFSTTSDYKNASPVFDFLNIAGLVEANYSEVSELKVNGIIYNPGMFLVLGGQRSEIIIAEIIKILMSPTEEIQFVINRQTADLDCDLGVYKIQHNLCSKLECLSFLSIKKYYYYPLSSYKFFGLVNTSSLYSIQLRNKQKLTN